jgi:hypothetical protein
MSAELDVWSLPRQVRCKGGRTRQTPAKRLTVDDGRVTLSQDGKTRPYHVHRELYPRVFRDHLRHQAWCWNGHPLMETRPDLPAVLAAQIGKPNIAVWGTGNRICA